jgi:hypothetical protein
MRTGRMIITTTSLASREASSWWTGVGNLFFSENKRKEKKIEKQVLLDRASVTPNFTEQQPTHPLPFAL